MSADTTTVAMSDEALEELLQLTLLNQRAEGLVLTPEEVDEVRSKLRKQHNL